MKKLILSLVFIFSIGAFMQTNAITINKNNTAIILVDGCAEEGAMMYEASRNRGLSMEESFKLAVAWYDECLENEMEQLKS